MSRERSAARRRFLALCAAGSTIAACAAQPEAPPASTLPAERRETAQPTTLPPTERPTELPATRPPTEAPALTPTRRAASEATMATQTAEAPLPNELGRLTSRLPQKAPELPDEPGARPMVLTAKRDTLLYVPAGYTPDEPAPLVVLLHGASGDAERGLSLLKDQADEAGLILVAPSSRELTWDVLVHRRFGRDVALIDAALERVFARYAVDPRRLAIGGFSDGASYALSLGISNGDLFSHVIAFSPGFVAALKRIGTPQIFVSHGTQDEILPIDLTSRRIVPSMSGEGYEVLYREFEGPHAVPEEIRRDAVTWLNSGKA